MSDENFSYKEMLVQVMGKIDNLAAAVNKKELLLNSIHEASAGRDEKIKDLKVQVVILEEEVKTLTTKVEALKAFNKTLVAIWSAFILFISIFGREVFNRLTT